MQIAKGFYSMVKHYDFKEEYDVPGYKCEKALPKLLYFLKTSIYNHSKAIPIG